MTVINPNSVAGINSITVQTGEALSVHKADGTLISTIVTAAGISTFNKVEIKKGTSGGATANSDAPLVVDNSTNSYIQFRSPNNVENGLLFGDNADNNSGTIIYDHSDDALTFGTSDGTEELRIDSAGQIGIGGITPDTWSTGRAITIGTSQATLWGVGDQVNLSGNAYFNSSWKAAATKAGASQIQQALGQIDLRVTGSVTADAAITWIDALRVTNTGQTKLNIASNGALTEPLVLRNSGTGAGTNVGMVFSNGDESSTGAGALARIKAIDVDNFDSDLVFETGLKSGFSNTTIERLRITSVGDVGIGTDTMNAPLTVVNNDNAGYIASFRQKHASNSAQIIIDSPSDSNVRPSSIDLAQGGTVKWSLGQAYSSTSSQAFHIATSALQANESGSKLTITTAGSVGIGTAVPGQSLEVFKQSGTNLVKVSTQANSTIGIELQKTGSTTQSWRIADGQTVNGALEIYDVTDSATRLLIDGSGKFCFGTYNSGFANNDSVANFVNAASAGTENPLLTLWNPTTAGDARASIDFLTNDNSGTGRDGAFIRASNDGVTAKAHLQFGTIKDETYAELIRFQSTGGISFNGDTAAANALDDYEEGTFTPTNSIGLTLTNNNPAYYIKIGKLVMVQFDISFSGASDTAQCGLIQSLPFTSENTTDHFSQGPLPHISTNSNFDLDTSLDDLLLFVGPGESRIDIFSFSINTTAARSSLVGRRIRHMMFYKAA